MSNQTMQNLCRALRTDPDYIRLYKGYFAYLRKVQSGEERLLYQSLEDMYLNYANLFYGWSGQASDILKKSLAQSLQKIVVSSVNKPVLKQAVK